MHPEEWLSHRWPQRNWKEPGAAKHLSHIYGPRPCKSWQNELDLFLVSRCRCCFLAFALLHPGGLEFGNHVGSQEWLVGDFGTQSRKI